MESGSGAPKSPVMSPIPASSVTAAPFLPISSLSPSEDDSARPLPPDGPPPPSPPPPDTFILSFTYPPPPAPIAVPTSAPIRKPPNYIGFTLPPPAKAPPVLGPGEKVAASVSTYYTNCAGIGLPEHKDAAVKEADRHVGQGKDKVPQWCLDDMRAYAKELEEVYGVEADVRPSRKRRQYRDDNDSDACVATATGSSGPNKPQIAPEPPFPQGPSLHLDPLACLPPPRASAKTKQGRKRDGPRDTSPTMTVASERSDPSSSGSSSYGDADAWNAKNKAKKGRIDVINISRKGVIDDVMGPQSTTDAEEDARMDAPDQNVQTISLPSATSPRTPDERAPSSRSTHASKIRSPSADSGMIAFDNKKGRVSHQADGEGEFERDELGSDPDSGTDIEIDRDDPDGDSDQDDAMTINPQEKVGRRDVTPTHTIDGDVRCAGWEWRLKGTWQAVIAARADIYEIIQPAVRFNVRVPGKLILDSKGPPPGDIVSSPDLLPAVRSRLDELASSFGVWITIVSLVQELGWRYGEAYTAFLEADKDIASESAKHLHHLREEREVIIRDGRDHEVMILGRQDQLEAAKRALLVLIDELSGWVSTVVRVPMYLHPAISGKKRAILTTITAQNGVLCYIPTPELTQAVVRDETDQAIPLAEQMMNGNVAPNSVDRLAQPLAAAAAKHTSPAEVEDVLAESDKIILTGTEESVRKVKVTLTKLADNKSKLEQPEKVYCVPQKLDYLLIRRSDSIRRCMHDSGVFVSFPALGSEGNVLEITSDDDNARIRTMKQVMMMTCELACAQVSLTAVGTDHPLSADAVSLLLEAIVSEHELDLIVRDSRFELWGTITDLRKALSVITTSGIFADYQSEVQIQLELSLEDKDFIQGKYAGKTRRIMRASDARLKMQNFNGYTLLVEIGGTLKTALLAFDLLAEELPTNISFCIPFNHHRRLIGRYGDAIQAIMRRYSCYIRMGAPMSAAGSIENEDNVWAQSPAKFSHSHNLLGMRDEVLLLIDETDRDYSLTSVDIPRQYHRLLQFRKASAIKAIERQAGVTIFFPAPQSGEDAVYLYGSKMSNDHAKTLFPSLMDPNATSTTPDTTMSQPAADVPLYPPHPAHRRGPTDPSRVNRRFRNPHQKVFARNGKAFGYESYRTDQQEAKKDDEANAAPVQSYSDGYQRWNKADSPSDHRGRSATVTSMGSSSSPSLDIDLARKPASPDSSITTASTQVTSDMSALATPVDARQQDTSYALPQTSGYSWLASGAGPGGVGGQFHVVNKEQSGFESVHALSNPDNGIASTYGSAAQSYSPDWVAPNTTTSTSNLGHVYGQQVSEAGWHVPSTVGTTNGHAQYHYPSTNWYPNAGQGVIGSYASPATASALTGTMIDISPGLNFGSQTSLSQGYTGSYRGPLALHQQSIPGQHLPDGMEKGHAVQHAPYDVESSRHAGTTAFQASSIWQAPGC